MPRSLHTAALVGCFVLLVTLLPVAARSAPADPPAPVAEAPAQPLTFVENVGQFAPGARFALQGAGGTLFAADDAIWLAQAPKDEQSRGANIRLSFAGAALHPQLEPFGRLDQQISYFRGSREHWRNAVPTWSGLRYRDLYPGVDLELTGADGRLGPRLVAHSSADLAAVRLQIDGADAVALDAQAIHLQTAAGPIALPLFSAATPGGTPLLPLGSARPSLRGSSVQLPVAASAAPAAASAPAANNDDSLIYSTYLGGSASDVGRAIAVDASGYVYVGGNTHSVDFPTKPGAFEPNYCGCQDAFIVKFRPGESSFVYATYIGGENANDELHSLAIDAKGNAYITGYTYSYDYPTTDGAYDQECGTDGVCNPINSENNRGDVFVTKINTDGSLLVYSTYIGGSNDDRGFDIAVDANGSAYITGHTASSDFPHLGAPLQGTLDAFAIKLNPAGTTPIYSTYIGGSGEENDFRQYDTLFGGIALDSNGAAYVVGSTNSANFPLTSGTAAAKAIDTFVVKLAPNNGQRLFSSLIGGLGNDIGKDIVVAPAGVYVLGNTDDDAQFPIDGEPYDGVFGGGSEMFLLRLNTAGQQTYSSWFGGDGNECVISCALVLGPNSDIYLTGETSSGDFPTSPNAYSTSAFKSNDIFVTRLNSTATSLIYGTYIGASGSNVGQDYASAIAVDAAGNAYVAGYTETDLFPTTANALFGTFGGGSNDAVVIELATQTTFTASGFIRDVQNKPVAGVAVRSSTGAVATTNNAGFFAFSSLTPGQYRFQASKQSYSFLPGPIDRAINSDSGGINFVALSTLAYIPLGGLPNDGREPPPPTPTPQPERCDKYEPNEYRYQPMEPIAIGENGVQINARFCNLEESSTKQLGEPLYEDNYAFSVEAPGKIDIDITLPDLPKLLNKDTFSLGLWPPNKGPKLIEDQGCFKSEIKRAYNSSNDRNWTCRVPRGIFVLRIYAEETAVGQGDYQFTIIRN